MVLQVRTDLCENEIQSLPNHQYQTLDKNNRVNQDFQMRRNRTIKRTHQ